MIRNENYKNPPSPPNLLFLRCVAKNLLLPPIEFCADCGTWHSATDDCVMIQTEIPNLDENGIPIINYKKHWSKNGSSEKS